MCSSLLMTTSSRPRVIPDGRASRKSGIHNHKSSERGADRVMDSGYLACARPWNDASELDCLPTQSFQFESIGASARNRTAAWRAPPGGEVAFRPFLTF